MKRVKDPEWTSRLLSAFATSTIISFFFGGMAAIGFLTSGSGTFEWARVTCRASLILSVMMVIFWAVFIPHYLVTVRKSPATLEWERYAQLEDQRKAELFRRFRSHQTPRQGYD